VLPPFSLWTELIDITGKGDPPSPSATAKDLQKEREIDALIKDPKKLPSHLQSQERRASRVDIDVRQSSLSNSAVFIVLNSQSTPTRLSTPRYSHCISTRTILSSATTLINAQVFPSG